MKVKLLEHEEQSWQRVAEVTSDTGETQTVFFNWHHEHGFDVENWYQLPNWLTAQFNGVQDLAQFLDENTYQKAYNKLEAVV